MANSVIVYAIRSLRRDLLQVLFALAVFGLGVASTAAAFSVLHSLLVSALPYANSERVVKLSTVNRLTGHTDALAPADFSEILENIQAFELITGYIGFERTLHGLGEAEFVQGIAASGSFFAVLGEDPLLGRTFTEADDTANSAPVVVISHDLWQRKFGEDHSAVGRAVRLDEKFYTLVGVMPQGFFYPRPVDFWTPLIAHSPRLLQLRGLRLLDAAALLPHGTSLATAQTELEVLSSRLQQAYPQSNLGWELRAAWLRDSLVGGLRPYLWALMCASVVFLAIACANVATLFLARSSQRSSEVAVRLSLGCGFARILHGFIIEGLLFSLLGGLLGAILTFFLLSAFSSLLASQAVMVPIRFSLAGWLFAFGLCGLSGVLFGLTPAGRFLRLDLVGALRGEVQYPSRRGRHEWLRPALVVAQVALSLTLCVAGTLLAMTLFRLRAIEPGFDADQIATFEFKLNQADYNAPSGIAEFQSRLLERVRAVGGVAAAGLSNLLPLEGVGLTNIELEQTEQGQSQKVEIGYRIVDGGFFPTLHIPLIAGRLFSQQDGADGPLVLMINQAAAQTLWPNEKPLGKPLTLLGQERTVIGIVSNIQSRGLSQKPPAELYLPSTQGAWSRFFLIVRAERPFDELTRDVRAVVRAIDNQLPLGRIRPLESIVTGTLNDRRARAIVFGFFALLALLLTVMGLYGLVVATIKQRMHELGVRMALGATKTDMLRMVLRQTGTLITAGLLIGFALYAASSHILQSLLHGVDPMKPAIYLSVSLILAVVALSAACIPILNAIRRDPMRSLRCE